ncbi:MAG TPA: hypothetical protein VFE05_24870 [Longimicrobiaceae bacterium]|jgi:hypothetical protein|nr:hypothetical protein [Longimicrobiaceae bacterium]
MSLLVDVLRPYWMPGLNEISGHQSRGLAAWVAHGEYQIYDPLKPGTAILRFTLAKQITTALAADCSRMSAAAFESLEGLEASTVLPKAGGWLLIRSYYAAFFAAHALLRMFSRSCTQLDTTALRSLHSVAELYGTRGAVTLNVAQYGCIVDTPGKLISIEQRSGGGGGSHGAMWSMFAELLCFLRTSILQSSAVTPAAQQVAAKLIELEQILTHNGRSSGGSWLSQVRNSANYQLAFGVWFPYHARPKHPENLFALLDLWKCDPLSINVWSSGGRDLQMFMEGCMLIVAICRAMSADMAGRCPKGKSFHKFGGVELLTRLQV